MFRKLTKTEKPNSRDYGKQDPRFRRGGYVLLPHVADKEPVDPETGKPAREESVMQQLPKWGDENDWDLDFRNQYEKEQESEVKGGVVDQKTLDPEEYGFDPESPKPEEEH